MPYIEREGRFRAVVTKFGLEPSSTSASVGFKCWFNLVYEWSAVHRMWNELSGLDTTTGTTWFIGRDGLPNEKAVETLKNALGWDGDVDSLDGKTSWRPLNCQVTVEREDYKGKAKYRARWINPWEDTYKGGDKTPKATPALVANIKAAFGQGGQSGGVVPF